MNRKDQKILVIFSSVIIGLTIISILSINIIITKIADIPPTIAFKMPPNDPSTMLDDSKKLPPLEIPKKMESIDDQFMPPKIEEAPFRHMRNGKDMPDIKRMPSPPPSPPPIAPPPIDKRTPPPHKAYEQPVPYDPRYEEDMDRRAPANYDYPPPPYYPPPPPPDYYDNGYDYDNDYYEDYYEDLESKIEIRTKKLANLNEHSELIDAIDMIDEDDYIIDSLEDGYE